MELSADTPHSGDSPAATEPTACGLHSKRLKELENAALQTSLISQMETGSGAEAGSWTEHEPGRGEQPNGMPRHTDAEAEAPGTDEAMPRVEEERTLTDHLNKRLLSSFLEKLNERDLALPGVQRLDCAVAEEDSNRAADEW